ncbi:hypothetical protein LCGC14_1770700 [marine sediment metagenome]|uniref:YopX protein domain-containing protein n=1 Tax=marine sediment metagenome TaxID=412755 RepID=A0A0F9JDA3_9ZZZZ
MRDLKFRAWEKTEGKMFKPVYLLLSKANSPPVVFENGGTIRNSGKLHGYSVELMQYTGLKDKNSVEVYEGDIVTDGINPPSAVTWDYTLLARLTEIDIEVIGNIYENRELLDDSK